MDGKPVDVVVVGAGQAGLALGYYLRRSGLSFVILDANGASGGSWRRGWHSLRAFSPARWTSLPGRLMKGGPDYYPTRDEVVDYFAMYEERYGLSVERPVKVESVRRGEGELVVLTDSGGWRARAVVSATGTQGRPYVPGYPGRDVFRGVQVHSSEYRRPDDFAGKRVLVVGGGNSGAQIAAELSGFARTTWVTPDEPEFLPDDVDGRVLFERATEKYRAKSQGLPEPPAASLANVVMVPSVLEARERGDLASVRPFERLTEDGVVWPGGAEEKIDAVVWCTGFRAALKHLDALCVRGPDGGVITEGTRSVEEPRLWLVGYGDWTGFASATVIGVGRTARETVGEITSSLVDDGDERTKGVRLVSG